MKQEDIFNAMGIGKADQEAMLKEESNVSLFKDAISKTHITRAMAVNDATITDAAVKTATDTLNKSHSETLTIIGKNVNVSIDPSAFTKDGVFDSDGFSKKVTTDFGTAITTLKDSSNGDVDGKYKLLEATNQKITGERDTYQQNLNDKIGELDSEKKRNSESEKQTKINGLFKNTFSGIKFDETENALTIEAIEGRILKGAKHDLDEKGEYTVVQLDGNSFMNESKTKSLTPTEVHLMFAVNADAKLIMNGVKPTPKQTPTPPPTPPPTPNPTPTPSKINNQAFIDRLNANADTIKESSKVREPATT